MRKLGVAAVLILCAFGASASNFRAADQVYVPIAGHDAGQGGSTFISDAFIANLSGESVDVSVIYVPKNPNTGGTAPRNLEEIRNRLTLRAYERKELLDVFANTLGKTTGFGLLIFNGCKAGANCGSDAQDDQGNSSNFRPISVQSRIYQTQLSRPNETTGQLFSGIPWYNFVSKLQSNVELDKVFFTGITNNGNAGQAGTYRTNIGIVNASEWSTTEIVFRAYQGTMTDADKKGEKVVQLGPLGNELYGFNDLFPGLTGANFFVTVEQRNVQAVNNPPTTCVEGCPAFLTYGSLLDNGSGDATTLEAQYMKELNQGVLDVLYPVSAGKKPIRRTVRH